MSEERPDRDSSPRKPDEREPDVAESLRGLADRTGHGPPSLGQRDDLDEQADGSVTWRPRQGFGVKLAAWAILALIGLGLAAMIAMLMVGRS